MFLLLFEVLLCICGVVRDSWPRSTHGSTTWETEGSVSWVYGPGFVISWFIGGVSVLYDAYTNPYDDDITYLDWIKSGVLISTGLCALAHTLNRAYNFDFGPSWAAAIYMSEKFFELMVLSYFVKAFALRRHTVRRMKAWSERSWSVPY